MAELTIDMTYGSALFQVAQDLKKENRILEDAEDVLSVLEKEKELSAFIDNPTIPAEEKKEAIKRIFEQNICKELLNLLYLLVDKRRTRHYSKIIRYYKGLVNKKEGFAYGTVFSVTPLTKKQIKDFESKTEVLMDSRVKLENITDASLIGGIKILINGKIIDASLRKRLNDLENILK